MENKTTEQTAYPMTRLDWYKLTLVFDDFLSRYDATPTGFVEKPVAVKASPPVDSIWKQYALRKQRKRKEKIEELNYAYMWNKEQGEW